LQRYFRTYSPDVASIERVLDKRRLYEACDAVGIETPVTHFAESPDEVAAVVRHARFPLLLKQRTQILSASGTKGVVVRDSAELMGAYRKFIVSNPHAAELLQRIPFASWPMMQEFHPNAHAGSYLISGFVDRGHRELVAQSAVKVLQYPRTLGIALCMRRRPSTQDWSSGFAICAN
jgi:predicted ATP-grasp superfamily ATP-dependent carboligase